MKFREYLNEAKYDDKKMLKNLKEVFNSDKFINELVKDIEIDKSDKPIVYLTVGFPKNAGISKTFEMKFYVTSSRRFQNDYEIEISYDRDTKIWYSYFKHICDFIKEHEEELFNILKVDEGSWENRDPYRRGNQSVFTQKEIDDYYAKMAKRGY